MALLDNSAPHNAPPSVSRLEECQSLSETATQCCFDPIILVSVATQTDDVPTIVASDNSSNGSSLVKTQASFTVPAEEWKIPQDHNYSMSVPMVYSTYGLDKDSLTPYTEIELDPLVENNIDNDFNDKEVCDYDFDEYKCREFGLADKKTLTLYQQSGLMDLTFPFLQLLSLSRSSSNPSTWEIVQSSAITRTVHVIFKHNY